MHTERYMKRIDDIRWGVSKGLIMGGLYSLFGALLYILDGPGRFDRAGINIGILCLAYLGGGIGAGLILGLLRDALGDRVTATFVSVLAALPVSFGMTLLTRAKPLEDWGDREIIIVVGSAVLIGCLGMAVLWKDRDLL